MNIKKEEAKFEELSLEILDLCPLDQTEEFIEGYLRFLTLFFEDIKHFYGLIENLDGSYYIDVEYTCDDTNRTIDIEANDLPSYLKINFIKGARLAEVNCLKAFISEFKTDKAA